MKKKLKIAIIFIFIIILFLVALMIYILKSQINIEGDNGVIDKEGNYRDVSNMDDSLKITKLYNNVEYFRVKDCLDTYASFSLDLQYSQNLEKEQLENTQTRMLSIIPDFVKKDLNINAQNVYKTIGLPDKYMRVDNITVSRQVAEENTDTTIYAYIVEGVLIDRENFSKENFKSIVLLDGLNGTFYIIPQKYIEKKRIDTTEGKELQLYSEEEIEDKTYNKYQSKAYTDQNICEDYFNTFRLNLEYDAQGMYDKLDKNYREKRFGSYSEFEKYIKENNVNNAKLASYLVNREDDYTEYVCKDQNENLYIFKEVAVKDYTITLDTYTLEQEKFNEEYEKATNQKKVMMNIDKFFQMLNAKDYKAAYEKLDMNFKNNYFKTEQDFENYIKQRVFSYNKVEYVSYNGDISGIFKYDLNLKNKQNETQEVSFSVVMQLKEGTDFVMSFNVQ